MTLAEKSAGKLLCFLNWCLLTQDGFDATYHRELISNTSNEIAELQVGVDEAKLMTKDFSSGPCFLSIDATLKFIGVERAKYFGGTIVGNDCHKLLRRKNIVILCDSLLTILRNNVDGDDEILFNETKVKIDQFKLLFSKYADCHDVFNSAKHLNSIEILALDEKIKDFFKYLRLNFKYINISPKLHMLEDNMISFITLWGAACGFFGEQGGDSIHSKFNMLMEEKHLHMQFLSW